MLRNSKLWMTINKEKGEKHGKNEINKRIFR